MRPVDSELELKGHRVGVVTPLGLGLDRALGNRRTSPVHVPPEREPERFARRLRAARSRAAEDGIPLVIRGTHWADGALLAKIEELLDTDPVQDAGLVVSAAGGVPASLHAFLDVSVVVGPEDRECFPAAYAGGDLALANRVFAYTAGWPEAVALQSDGSLSASSALLTFVQELRLAEPGLCDLSGMLAAVAGGLTAQEVAACCGLDTAEVFSSLARLEELGLVMWRGDHAALTSEALADALADNSTRKRAAAALVTAGLGERAHVQGRGSDVGPGTRTAAELLSAAESRRDQRTWEAVAMSMSSSSDPELEWEGVTSLVRLDLMRGRIDDARRHLTRLELMAVTDPAQTRLREGLAANVRLFALQGIAGVYQQSGRNEPADMMLVSPHDLTEGTVQALKLLFDVVRDPAAPGPSADELAASGLERALGAFAALVAGDVDLVRSIDFVPEDPASALGRVLQVFCECVDGHFLRADATLTALVGSSWTDVSPLHTVVATLVSAGTDVDRCRRVVRRLPQPMSAQSGTIILRWAHARAAAVTGHRAEAASQIAELWDLLVDAGYLGNLPFVVWDALELLWGDDGVNRVLEVEPRGRLKGPIRFGRALLGTEPRAWEASLAGVSDSSLQRARAHRLVGRRYAELQQEEDACRHLETAASIFDTIGAPVDDESCLTALRSAGSTRGRKPVSLVRRTEVDSLTGAEQEVLALVLRGLTNAQIAAQLHVSVSTVARHVSGVLRKYGVKTRRDLHDAVADSP